MKRYYGTLQTNNPSAISGSRVLGTIGLPENIYLYKIIVRGYAGDTTYNVRNFTIEGSLDNSTFFSISGSVVFDTILYRAIWTNASSSGTQIKYIRITHLTDTGHPIYSKINIYAASFGNTVSVVNDNGVNKYALNGNTNYVSSYYLRGPTDPAAATYLYNRPTFRMDAYQFKSIPQSHPMAIIEKDIISYNSVWKKWEE